MQLATRGLLRLLRGACQVGLTLAPSAMPSAAAGAAMPRQQTTPTAQERGVLEAADAASARGESAKACDLLLGLCESETLVASGPRLALDASVAAAQRVDAWPPEARRAWRERAGLPAALRLESAGADERTLAEVERRWPRTPAAATAALRLADLGAERGDHLQALGWLERAAEHGAAPETLSARRAALSSLLDNPAVDGAWRLVALLPLEREAPPHQDAGGVAPASGTLFVQQGDRLLAAGRDGAGTWQVRAIELAPFVAEELDPLALPARGARTARGRAACAGDASRLVCAVGRARGEHGNALVALRIADDGSPSMAWSATPRGIRRLSGELDSWPETLRGAVIEHSGSPLVAGGAVVELVRVWRGAVDETRTESWLCVHDLADGRLVEARQLDEGAVERASLRGAADVQPLDAAPAPAPLAVAARWLLPTGTGSLLELEVCDRRVRTRRTTAAATGALRERCVVLDDTLWAPRESDQLVPLAPGLLSAPWPGLLAPLGGGLGLERLDAARVRVAAADGSASSAPVPCLGGSRAQAVAVGTGVLVATGTRIVVLDRRAALARKAVVELGAKAEEPLGWILGPGCAWLVRERSLVRLEALPADGTEGR